MKNIKDNMKIGIVTYDLSTLAGGTQLSFNSRQ